MAMPALALATAPPRVTLLSPPAPYDGAIAAARTCYSPRVIERSEITDKQRDSIGPLTFEGGHHTVFQHAHFEFGLENISRQLVWSVLHSYPFYNSEQSSQRYVKLNEPRAFVPPITGEALDVYEQAVLRRVGRLREALGAAQGRCVGDPERAALRPPDQYAGAAKTVEREAEKKAIETARYVIPIGAFTSMVHTVSGIVLHRLHRMLNAGDVPYEAAMVIGAMVDLVKEVDPMFFEKIGFETLRARHASGDGVPARRARRAMRLRAEFDRRLGGRVSRLRDWSAGAERVVADAVRSTFGLTTAEMDDDGSDRSRDEPGEEPVSRRHARRRVSLADDARAQSRQLRVREAAEPHRRLAGPAPPHGAGVAADDDARRHDAPDYVTPRLIRQNPAALAVYEQAMADAWTAKNRLLALGVPLEYALYVLPNAKALRLVESGSFIALQHKWTLRTCFNAQEEIYLASMDEIGAGEGDPPAARAPPRPAVRAAQQDRVAALHRRHALLRRAGLELVPERRAPP